MLKLMGCFLLFLSCTAMGFVKSCSYKARVSELENIMEILKLLNLEMTYKRDPLAKTFQKVAALKPCWFAEVLQHCSQRLAEQIPLREAWQLAIEEKTQCPLHQKDLAILQDMTLGLGRSDVEGQQKLFEPAILRMEASLTEAKEQERMQGRMYRGLGVAAGVVIAIILI